MFHENLEQISPSSSFQILDVLFTKATVHDNTSCITRLLFSQVLAKKTPLIIIMHNGVSTRYPFRNHCDGQTTYCTVLYSCVNSLTLIYPLKMKKLFNMKTRNYAKSTTSMEFRGWKKCQTAISMYKNFQNIQVKISAERASLWIFIGRVEQNKSTGNILWASHLEIKLLSFHANIYMYMYFLLWHWRVSYLPLVHGHFIKSKKNLFLFLINFNG